MRIKSYFVNSVDEAIAQAREELGEDALLLSTRKVDAEPGSAGGYEVVIGCDTEVEPAPPVQKPDENRSELTSELERLRMEMAEIHRLLSASAPVSKVDRVPEIAALHLRLMDAGFDPALAGQIVDRVEAGMNADAPAAKAKRTLAIGWKARRFDWMKFQNLLREELSLRVKFDARLGVEESDGTVVAMVGPGGAGKTTTLMKIAAFQVAPNRPVRLLSLDNTGLERRIQLQFFARKTGITFAAVEEPESLPGLIENARKDEIVLIDTPSQSVDADREKLARILTNCPGIDVHLVVPGYMAASALRQCVSKYKIFRPAKMLVTKLDETQTFGTAVSEAVRAGMRISLVTNGVSIAGDLYEASVDDLVSMALGRDEAEAACA